MIPLYFQFVNVQRRRRECTVSSDDTVQFTATKVFNSQRPRCSTSPPYSLLIQNTIQILQGYLIDFADIQIDRAVADQTGIKLLLINVQKIQRLFFGFEKTVLVQDLSVTLVLLSSRQVQKRPRVQRDLRHLVAEKCPFRNFIRPDLFRVSAAFHE